MLRKLKIGPRLILLIAIQALILVVVGGTALFGLNLAARSTDVLNENVTEGTVSEAVPVADAPAPAPAPIPAPGEAAGLQRFAVSPASGAKVEFAGSKVTGSHDGGFKEFTGEINLIDARVEQSSINIEIPLASMWTDNDKLTEHLLSPDFFDAESHPTASFISTSVSKTAAGYDVTGNLEMRGVSKSVTFPATITVGDGEITADAEFFIKRFDWGIVYEGRADDLIRDEVVLKLHIVGKA